MAEIVGLQVNNDPLFWAKQATTRTALTNVIKAYANYAFRFEPIVEAHLKAGRLVWEGSVLKVGRTAKSKQTFAMA